MNGGKTSVRFGEFPRFACEREGFLWGKSGERFDSQKASAFAFGVAGGEVDGAVAVVFNGSAFAVDFEAGVSVLVFGGVLVGGGGGEDKDGGDRKEGGGGFGEDGLEHFGGDSLF